MNLSPLHHVILSRPQSQHDIVMVPKLKLKLIQK